VRALERLARLAPEQADLAEYFSTHPRLDERIRVLRETLRAGGMPTRTASGS
jgi:Zn-dependent protease with chaperone function